MNEIIEIFNYSTRTAIVKFSNKEIAERAEPGNFIIIRFSENGPRLPFSITDVNREQGVVEFIIHRAEGIDNYRQHLVAGLSLPDVLGPLGKPAEIDKGKNVICSGDGAGFIPLIPIIRALHENGCHVWAVMSEKSEKISCISDEVENYCDRVILAAEDNLGATIERVIKENSIEKIWMAGPTGLLKDITSVADSLDLPAQCVLNMIMIDGIGLCGCCRVMVDGQRKQTCIDGPAFDARKVDFDQLLNRQRLFE